MIVQYNYECEIVWIGQMLAQALLLITIYINEEKNQITF